MIDPAFQSSSLDRFLWERGTAMCGMNFGSRTGLLALRINSFVQLALGFTFLPLGLALRGTEAGPPFLAMGPIFLGVGTTLAIIHSVWSKRMKATAKPEIRL